MNESLLWTVLSIGFAVTMVAWAMLLFRSYRSVGGGSALLRPFPPDVQDEARRLEHEGRSGEALKFIRDRTGLGLGGAKTVLDALRQGQRLPVNYDESAELLASMDPQMSGYVRDMMQQGRQDEAVRALRARVDIGLTEAKSLTEAIGRRI